MKFKIGFSVACIILLVGGLIYDHYNKPKEPRFVGVVKNTWYDIVVDTTTEWGQRIYNDPTNWRSSVMDIRDSTLIVLTDGRLKIGSIWVAGYSRKDIWTGKAN